MVQLQPEYPIVGAKHRRAEAFGNPQRDPLVAAAAQGGRRAGVVGDAAVAAAEHQDLDAPSVAAKGMVDKAGGQGGELAPQRFQDRRW
jgi:hypothetical protein